MPSVFSSPFWSNLFSSDLAIDLGTASVLVQTRQAGRVVIYEPSIVALNARTKEVEAVGDEAKQLLGRTPQGVYTVRPLRDGMIYEVDAAEKMLGAFIHKARPHRSWSRTRIVVSIPPMAHQVARRAMRQVCYDAKASEVFLVDQTMVAAMGAGIPINEKRGCMIVDIGGGTTDVAVISFNGKVFADSIGIAGDEMDEAIHRYILEKYNLLISPTAAEQVKWGLGSAYPTPTDRTLTIAGQDQFEGLPRTLTLTEAEIREALAEPVSAILGLVRKALNDTPPQLAADLVDRGICLTGGGSKIQGLDLRISKETHLPCYRAENPETAVVRGTAMLLQDIPFLRRIQIRD
ncbi:rod shape-determining protein [Mesoterricola silvestris]|uniref:Cell shape-determining protein MreB n=1 Tax=Mesoterricola silvestris TaxID=2927979 RepID=A0AA48KA32_9BACT|nr:rod shape-determining protein [Mesoterricola silvestris]BDU73700.1 rod shape-determining protein [Mesoterricola silvestris]